MFEVLPPQTLVEFAKFMVLILNYSLDNRSMLEGSFQNIAFNSKSTIL